MLPIYEQKLFELMLKVGRKIDTGNNADKAIVEFIVSATNYKLAIMEQEPQPEFGTLHCENCFRTAKVDVVTGKDADGNQIFNFVHSPYEMCVCVGKCQEVE